MSEISEGDCSIGKMCDSSAQPNSNSECSFFHPHRDCLTADRIQRYEDALISTWHSRGGPRAWRKEYRKYTESISVHMVEVHEQSHWKFGLTEWRKQGDKSLSIGQRG